MQSGLEMRLDMLEGMLEQAHVERRKAEAEQQKFDRYVIILQSYSVIQTNVRLSKIEW